MDAVIYTRVSTDDQREKGFSLQDQERRLRAYCEQHGKNILKHYQDDHSAKDFNRPQFQQFLADLKAKKIKPKQLVVVRWDRFSRNLLESLAMKATLKELGVDLQFLENNYDEAIPENLIPLVIQMAMPQVENERRGINTKQGMRQALRQGRWMWKAPKGYVNDPVTKIVKKSPDAHFVIEAFRLVSLGLKTPDAIRKELNRAGFKCSKQSLLNILRNPFYTGQIVLDAWKNEPREVVKGIHEPIIDEDTFSAVQAILDGRNRKQAKPSKIKLLFPLRGHLKCRICGNNLTASSSKGRNKKYHYYHCQHGCKERIEADLVNSKFESFLANIRVNTEVAELYTEILRDVFEEHEGTKESRLMDNKNKLAEMNLKLKSLDFKWVSGSIADDDYRRISGTVKEEIARMEQINCELSVVETRFDHHLMYGISFLSKITFYFTNAPLEIKHKIIDSIFPGKLIFDGEKYRTGEESTLLSLICSDSITFGQKPNTKAIIADGLSSEAPPAGLEPATL
ncbi:MAG: hypothetical protein C5B59_18425 [Bacteroidetes bacterium]|nr:MAG: hypothetical protein C5B59_18425 [Bacteroidota bacterium]